MCQKKENKKQDESEQVKAELEESKKKGEENLKGTTRGGADFVNST